MPRRVFYSFHYEKDCWRVGQIRNIGSIEGNKPVSDNEWEDVVSQGEQAIKNWIEQQLYRKSCTIVLIGSETAGRKWVEYEIKKTWDDGKGLLGVYIHNIKDKQRNQSRKGRNPFENLKIGERNLSNIVKAYDPPYVTSKNVYNYIKDNIADWVDEAIEIRESF